MSGPGDSLARAAEALVGTPFRLHGRDPATGLDCVGLVEASLARIGIAASAPQGYAMRNLSLAAFLPALVEAGFAECAAGVPVKPGDIVLVAPSPGQFHVLVAGTACAFVHAHAGLGRVVTSPVTIADPKRGHWRLAPR